MNLADVHQLDGRQLFAKKYDTVKRWSWLLNDDLISSHCGGGFMLRLRKIFPLSLKNMLRTLLILFLVAVISTALTFSLVSFQSAKQSGEDEFAAIVQSQQQRLDGILQKIKLNLISMINSYSLQCFFSQDLVDWRMDHLNQVESLFSQYLSEQNAAIGICVNGIDGMRIIRCQQNEQYGVFYVADSEFGVLMPRYTKQYKTIPYQIGSKTELYYSISYPIYYIDTSAGNFSRTFCGSITVMLDVSSLIDESLLRLSERQYFVSVQYFDQWEFTSNAAEQSKIKGNTLKQSYSLIDPNLTFTFFLSENELYESIYVQIVRCVAISIVLVILYGIVFALLVREISGSVSVVIKGLSNISYGNLKYRMPVGPDNEIGRISFAVNSMLDKIENMTQCIIRNQEKLHQAQLNRDRAYLRFFQSQISPHFLYNALACIHSIAAQDQNQRIETIAESMSGIIRYSLKEKPFVTISDELRCLNNYLDIIEARYNRHIHFKLECDVDLLGMNCLKMLLQPLVENCLLHGIAGNLNKGRILLQISQEQDLLCVSVTDNGRGIDPKKLIQLQDNMESIEEASSTRHSNSEVSTGIGLSNIRHRLRLRFGERASLNVSSKYGYYTQVKIKFPSCQVSWSEADNDLK